MLSGHKQSVCWFLAGAADHDMVLMMMMIFRRFVNIFRMLSEVRPDFHHLHASSFDAELLVTDY